MRSSPRMAWGVLLVGGLAGSGGGRDASAAPLNSYELKDHGVVSMPGDGSFLTLARDHPVRIDERGNVAVRPAESIDVPSIGKVWITDSAVGHGGHDPLFQVGYTLNASTGKRQVVTISNGEALVRDLNGNYDSHYAVGVNALGTIIARGKMVGGLPGAQPGEIEDGAIGLTMGTRHAHMYFMNERAIHPFGINDANQIVGTILEDGVAHAYLTVSGWTLDMRGADVNDWLDPSGGWVFNAATDINNQGEIVGYATDGAGKVHAIQLTPVPVPEPTVTETLAAGALVLLARHVRTSRGTRSVRKGAGDA